MIDSEVNHEERQLVGVLVDHNHAWPVVCVRTRLVNQAVAVGDVAGRIDL
eukprot:COSAG04_NODE_950_length_9211_cov_69.923068_12_plen_50_part_00